MADRAGTALETRLKSLVLDGTGQVVSRWAKRSRGQSQPDVAFVERADPAWPVAAERAFLGERFAVCRYNGPSAHQGASRPRQAPSAPGFPNTVWPRPVSCRGRQQRTRLTMEHPMDDKSLPDNADLAQLRAQAKELRRAFAGTNPAAVARARAILPHAGAEITLRDAQLVIAREHGFAGWRELAAGVVAQHSNGRDLDRWFAVELNNGTWDLIDNGLSEQSPRTERDQALYAAYAAAHHWTQVGTVANRGRAEHLIATVATVDGSARCRPAPRRPVRRTHRRAPGGVRRLGSCLRRRGHRARGVARRHSRSRPTQGRSTSLGRGSRAPGGTTNLRATPGRGAVVGR